MNKQLKGTLFESVEDVCRTFTRAVEDIRKSTKAEEWNKWFYRMAKCITAEGRFFGKNGIILCLESPVGNECPETWYILICYFRVTAAIETSTV